MKRCFTYSLAKRFQFQELCEKLDKEYRSVRYRDVLHVQQGEGDAYLFSFGCMVCWGMSLDQEQRLIERIQNHYEEALPQPISDSFEWSEEEKGPRIQADIIRVTPERALEQLAISHALAQSIKLVELEAYAERTIQETAHIPRNIAAIGRSGMRRNDIAKMRGRLFLVESDIHLHHGLLDTPEFFWEHPELEPSYVQFTRYLDVRSRLEVLNKKLQVIHDMFDMLAEEQKHKHSSQLEWIIIGLIAFEILIFFLHDLFKLF